MGELFLKFGRFKKLAAKVLNKLTHKLNDHTNACGHIPSYPGNQYEHWASAFRFDDISLEEALNNREASAILDTKCGSLVIAQSSDRADQGFVADVDHFQNTLHSAVAAVNSFDGAAIIVLSGTYYFDGSFICHADVEIIGESKDCVKFVTNFSGDEILHLSKGTFRNITFISETGKYFIGGVVSAGMSDYYYTESSYPVDLIFDNCKFEFRSNDLSSTLQFDFNRSVPYTYCRVVFNECDFINYRTASPPVLRAVIHVQLLHCLDAPPKFIFNRCNFYYGNGANANYERWLYMYSEFRPSTGQTENTSEEQVTKATFYRCNIYNSPAAAVVNYHNPICGSNFGLEMHHCNLETKTPYAIHATLDGLIFMRLFFNNFTSTGLCFYQYDNENYDYNLNTLVFIYNVTDQPFPAVINNNLVLYGNTNIVRSGAIDPLYQGNLVF